MDVKNIRSRAIGDIDAATNLLRLANALELVDLPEGVKLSYWGATAYGDSGEGHLDLNVVYLKDDGQEAYEKDDVANIPWAERIKPIGAALRTFHCRDIEREVTDYGAVIYSGKGTLKDPRYNKEDWQLRVRVNVNVGGVSPACEVKTVKTRRVVYDTKVVVTCPEASHA